MLLSREMFIPLGDIPKSRSLHCFGCNGCLPPWPAGSRAILARELLNSKTRSHSYSPTSKGGPVSSL